MARAATTAATMAAAVPVAAAATSTSPPPATYAAPHQMSRPTPLETHQGPSSLVAQRLVAAAAERIAGGADRRGPAWRRWGRDSRRGGLVHKRWRQGSCLDVERLALRWQSGGSTPSRADDLEPYGALEQPEPMLRAMPGGTDLPPAHALRRPPQASKGATRHHSQDSLPSMAMQCVGPAAAAQRDRSLGHADQQLVRSVPAASQELCSLSIAVSK